MNIVTHALIGWVAGRSIRRQPRDIALIAGVSLLPDIDAAGALLDVARGGEAEFFSAFHHKFGHCLPFCLLLVLAIFLYRKDARLSLWCAAIFHLHLLCDMIGARGPDGYQWPIYYLFPFSDYGMTWSGQWEINAWPNILLTVWLLYVFLRKSALDAFSPLVLVSQTADRAFVQTLQRRFGISGGSAGSDSNDPGVPS